MKRRNITLAAAMIMTAAMLMAGCGAKADNTQQTQTSKTEQTQASATDAPVQETQKVQETQAAQEQQTQEQQSQAQQPDTEASDSEQYVDNPAADGGEGDTNGFYDDAGTWITVHKNSSGQWVDESGMVYQFGDDGVTDANGNFYPY